jgi:hypothetical protein
MRQDALVKLGGAIAMLLLAALLLWRFLRDENGVSEKAFFYDVVVSSEDAYPVG